MATPQSLKIHLNEINHTTPPSLLYVEDDVEEGALFKAYMEQEGFHVDMAHTGAEAVAHLSRRMYDLVVLDHMLPKLDGIQILRQLIGSDRHPPTIMIASEADAASVVEALQLGITDFLFKTPHETFMQQLPLLVERVVAQYRRRAECEAMVEGLHDQNRKLELLNRATQIFTSALDAEQIALQLVSTICEFTDAEGSSVWLLTEQEELECVAIYAGDEHITPRHVILSPREGIAGWSFTHSEVVIVNDVANDPRFSVSSDIKLNFHTQALLAAPMRAPARVLGVLELVNKRSGDFTPIDGMLAETLATSAAIAIENARHFQHLHQQAEELRQRNEELDAFAHTVAHDLKTPLSVIAGYADMLRETFAELHPDEAKQYLKQVIDNSMRMDHIIDSLLLLAGVRGVAGADIVPVAMAPIVNEVMKRVEFMLQERNAAVHIPESWPTALGYGPWLEEVWYNYIVNALKYGGDPPELTLGFDPPEDGIVCFWIRDNGPGVPEDVATLFRAPSNRARSDRRKGYGLGLSIVKRIVERLNGSVGAKTGSGSGSCFYFTLPVSIAPDNEAPAKMT